MKTTLKITILCSILAMTGALFAQESADQSLLTLPWDEFKDLIHLDENIIVLPLETFQKLVALTGSQQPPEHVVKQGQVVLTRAEFNALVDQMKPPQGADRTPPFDYLITKASYSGKMAAQNTRFTGSFDVTVLKKETFLKIPFLPQAIALEDVRINGEQALVVSEQGYHQVVIDQAGAYSITASFSIKSELDKGPHRIDLNIQQTPITLLQLEIPLIDIEVEVQQSQQMAANTRGTRTLVEAIIAPGRQITVQWKKKITAAEKIPAKLYCEVHHLISIEDDALKINSDLNYSILHSEIENVRVAIPENVNILSVSGGGVGEWQEVTQNEQKVLLVPFNYGTKGNITVRIVSEIPLSEKGVTNAFYGVRALDTVRETGFIGIELNTSAEVKIVESDGLERIAVQKLPSPLYNRSVKPLIEGFKYLKHPFGLVLEIEKHEKIAVPVATISSANAVTLFTEDGKVVHRLIYQIRNSAKQFLEIQLPEGADVWSVFVGNEPVESSLNSEGKLLVPLIRSRSVENRLDTFPVEVIYCLVEKQFSLTGVRESSLPAVDLLASQIIWSVYLPNDYTYFYFKSTMEKEEIIRGLNILHTARRQFDGEAMKEMGAPVAQDADEYNEDKMKKVYKGRDYRSQFRNVPLQEEQIQSQLSAEMEFSGRLDDLAQVITAGGLGTGIMPIQIEIPTSGQLYRFARTIVKPEDPLTMRVTYSRNWTVKSFKWLIFILIILFFILIRKSLKKGYSMIAAKMVGFKTFFGDNRDYLQKAARFPLTPFFLFGLFVITLFVSYFLALVILFLFWCCVLYQVYLHREAKKAKK